MIMKKVLIKILGGIFIYKRNMVIILVNMLRAV